LFDSQFLAFAGLALLLTLTPGIDTMLVLKNSLAGGQRSGLFSALGICAGLCVHATLSALGLSVILVQSALAFEIVKIAGALYLFYLGFSALWAAWRGQKNGAASAFSASKKTPRPFREGFLTNLLNPKVAVFYLAVLPQFVSPTDPAFFKPLLLASVHLFTSFVWLAIIALFVARLRRFVTRPGVRRGMEGATGAVLVGLGVKLALEKR
jgi:RhtB (resistance to homoserine/threonine) family protein